MTQLRAMTNVQVEIDPRGVELTDPIDDGGEHVRNQILDVGAVVNTPTHVGRDLWVELAVQATKGLRIAVADP